MTPGIPEPAPGIRYGRPSGETPDLAVRLEGLASRGRLSLAAPPGGAPPSAPPAGPPVGPDFDDTLADTPGYRPYDDVYGDHHHYGDAYGDDYDDDVEDAKPARGCLRVVVATVLVLALLCGAAGFWIRGQVNPGGPLGKKVTVEVVEGQSTGEIGETLEDAGVITSSTVWTWYVRLNGGGHIQAGSYELNKNMSMGATLAALEKDPLPPGTTRETVPPGFTVHQVIARLTDPEHGVPGFTAEKLNAALADPALKLPLIPAEIANLEGTLFPETYDIGEGVTEAQFLQRMVKTASDTFAEVNLEGGAAAIGHTPYEVLIVASLIEEEIKVPEERPMLAQLIYNRLSQNTPLGIDATSCYGIAETPCNLQDDNPSNGLINPDSPYDTRTRQGLPQTPISSPSKASIEAAMHPDGGQWLYSVLDPNVNSDGKHHLFTASADEFNAAKERCKAAGLGCG